MKPESELILVIGAGFSGSVSARALADAGHRVVVIERRAHLGGNAWDKLDDSGVRIHPYGPHIFHTNSKRIVEWLSRFTEWRPYEHKVLAQVDGKLLPIPINRTTVNQLYGLDLDENGMAVFLEKVREQRHPVRTSEDLVLNSVGRDLCDKFFRGYTRKQWGLDLSQLDASVAARIPTRHNDDDRYFSDSHQAMPLDGYCTMFKRMLNHPLITVDLETDFDTVRHQFLPIHTFYTGPVDAYFSHCFGKLPYRSLRFEHTHLPDTSRFQPVGTINYPNENAFTRITEFKHLTGQEHEGTSIMREYPQEKGDPYYPVPSHENEALHQRYRVLADKESNVTFIGRLAQYRYYNMDQVVGAALATVGKFLERYFV